MKLLIQILLMSSALLAAPASMAGHVIQTAANNCKAEAQQRFSLEGEPTRVKFKTAMGSRRAPRILLQVFPQAGDPFKAVCATAKGSVEVVSLSRLN